MNKYKFKIFMRTVAIIIAALAAVGLIAALWWKQYAIALSYFLIFAGMFFVLYINRK